MCSGLSACTIEEQTAYGLLAVLIVAAVSGDMCSDSRSAIRDF